MKGAAPALLTALALGLPLPAAACHQLSANVWMCPGDTIWQEASWDPYGDGSTLLVEDFVLNFTEDWPGAEIRDELSTLEEQFVTYAELAEADTGAPLEIHRQEVLELPSGKAFRSLQRDNYNDIETVSAVMLAEVSEARIMLWLDGPQTLDWAEIDTASRGVLGLLRDNCAEAATCASPDQSRVESE